jgi:hypothetical protein
MPDWKGIVGRGFTPADFASYVAPRNLEFHREDKKTTHKHCPSAAIKKADIVRELRSRLYLETAGEHPVSGPLGISR